ncbi:MAG: hypothetical protein NTV38_08065, partial [Chloroflexi bacterium]|nr:hypothetical protein [Chloroflexota bacterium]
MQSSIEKLRKFFRLEHENGYTNTAVIGGLANVLSLWEGEARNDKLPEEIVQATSATLRAYAALTPAERLDSLKALWKQILEKVPEAALGKKQASAKRVQRPPQPTQAPVEPQPVPEPEAPPVAAEVLVVPVVEGKPGSAVQEQGPAAQAPVKNSTPGAATAPAPVPAPRSQRTIPGRAEAHPGGVTSKRPIALNASLTVLAGVGPRHAAMLTRLGLNTLGDMLYNFPHRYEDYSQLKPIRDVFYGQQLTVIGEVTMVNSHPLRGGKMSITEAVI